MDNRPEIERKIGTPLGEKDSDRKSVVKAFRSKGLSGLDPTSVSRLKAGMISGERTKWRLDASRILEEDDAVSKNQFYQQIAQTGVEQRLFNTAPQRDHVLKTDHFVEDIAKTIGQDPQVVRRCIRGMRTDLVLAQTNASNPTLLRQFSEIAERFIDAKHRLPPSMHSPGVNTLNQVWDHTTIEDFYRNIYAVSEGRTIGGWTPYEMEALALFYTQQDEAGNHLTPFDRLVLNTYIKGLPTSGVVSKIKGSVGIDIDQGVIEQHRNIMAYGRPVYQPKK